MTTARDSAPGLAAVLVAGDEVLCVAAADPPAGPALVEALQAAVACAQTSPALLVQLLADASAVGVVTLPASAPAAACSGEAWGAATLAPTQSLI